MTSSGDDREWNVGCMRDSVTRALFHPGLRWGSVAVVAVGIFYASVLAVPPEIVIDGSGAVSGSGSGAGGGTDSSVGIGSEPGSETGGVEVFALLSAVLGFTQSKWRHIVAYAALAAVLVYATAGWEMRRWQRALFVVAVASSYGLGIEIVQSFVPHRSAQASDVLANTLGSSLVVLAYLTGSFARRASRAFRR